MLEDLILLLMLRWNHFKVSSMKSLDKPMTAMVLRRVKGEGMVGIAMNKNPY